MSDASKVKDPEEGWVDIGSRRELFVDEYLIERLEGDAELRVHKPEPHEVVFRTDKPWEREAAYFAVFQDGEIYRMYYRAFHHGQEGQGELTCYAESRDGINWIKPELGLFEFEGSAKNNIVLGGDRRKYPATAKWKGDLGTDLNYRADIVPFVDRSPGTKKDAKYKALIRGCRGRCQYAECRRDYGMYPFKSPDGIHWTLMSERPVITRGKFDSQNLAFWDDVRGHYVAFVRDVFVFGDRDTPSKKTKDTEEIPPGWCRDIRTCTSRDFLNWTDPVFLEYPGQTRNNLYTNAVMIYERAPHLLIGFPTRFIESTEQTEPTFMASRDGGRTFRQWPDAVIPFDTPEERDGNRSNYMVRGLVELPGNSREYSVYATEGYFDGPEVRVRRFTYRVDGFVSAHASDKGGEIATRLISFDGSNLFINFSTSEAGSVRVEVQDNLGNPLESYALDDSETLHGDALEQPVTWGGASLEKLIGIPVRLRFVLKEADLYSYRFGKVFKRMV